MSGFFKELIQDIKSNNLLSLYLSGDSFTPQQKNEIIEAFKSVKDSKITSISLNEECDFVLKLTDYLPNLTKLENNFCNSPSTGRIIAKMLDANPNINTLQFRYFDPKKLKECFREVLTEKRSQITKLIVEKWATCHYITNDEDNVIEDNVIAENFQYLPNLTCLEIGHNNISGNELKIIAENLQQCPKLESVDLSHNGITDDDVMAIEKLCKQGVKYVQLCLNIIRDKGAIFLASLLKQFPNFNIELTYNDIGSKGAAELVKHWTHPICDLSCNNIDINGIEELADALAQNQHIEIIKLERHKLDNKSIGILLESLHDKLIGEDHKLKLLDLSSYKLDDNTRHFIAEYVRNGKLTSDIKVGGCWDIVINLLTNLNNGAIVEFDKLGEMLIQKARNGYIDDLIPAIKYLADFKDDDGLPLIDINYKSTEDGSTILTYFGNNKKMVNFLMSRGAEYTSSKSSRASIEAQIAKNTQSTHDVTVAEHNYKLLTDLRKNFVQDQRDDEQILEQVLSLINAMKNTCNDEGDVTILVPGSDLNITINQKARASLADKKTSLLNAKDKEKRQDIEKIRDVIKNKFFEAAYEGLTQVLKNNHATTLVEEKVYLKEVLSLVYKGFIDIARGKPEQLSDLIDNLLDLITEIVDFSTTYQLKGSSIINPSCSTGTVQKILSTIDCKDERFGATPGLPEKQSSLSEVDDINIDALKEYAINAWKSLSPQERDGFIKKFIDYDDNHSVNCFRAKIYQILQETFSNRFNIEDIAKIQSAILPKNQEKKSTLDPDETLPKEIFDLILSEYRQEWEARKEQYIAKIQDSEIIEKIKLMSLESFMEAFNSSKNKEPFEQLYAITLQAYRDANAQHEFEQKAFWGDDYCENVFKSALKSQDSGYPEIQMSLAQQYAQKENHGAGVLEEGRQDLSGDTAKIDIKPQSDMQKSPISLEEVRAQRIKYFEDLKLKHAAQQYAQKENHGAGVLVEHAQDAQQELSGDGSVNTYSYDSDAHH